MKPTEAIASTALNGVSRVSGRLAGAGAFTLFHMPLARSRVRTAERALLDTARTRRIEVNGRSTVTYQWGSGERPVLLVHGWQSRGSRFADFVPGLIDRGHSVITFDAPGHGDSAGRSTTILDYRDILGQLHGRYGTFDALVAHSLGALGSFFALRDGVTAERIVTLGGVCDYDYLVEEFSTALKLRPALRSALLARVGRKLFPGVPADRMPFSAVHATEDVTVPILVVHDEDDTRIGVEQGRRLAGAFGERARLVTTSGLGHRRILQDPEVIATVLEFIEGGGTGAAAPRRLALSAD